MFSYLEYRCRRLSRLCVGHSMTSLKFIRSSKWGIKTRISLDKVATSALGILNTVWPKRAQYSLQISECSLPYVRGIRITLHVYVIAEIPRGNCQVATICHEPTAVAFKIVRFLFKLLDRYLNMIFDEIRKDKIVSFVDSHNHKLLIG